MVSLVASAAPQPTTISEFSCCIEALATDRGQEDALNLSPRLQPTVPNLNRSPSPQRFVSQQQTAILHQSVSPPSSKHSKKLRSNRRRKTQPSQGDAVLVGFLGGHKHPDTARRAGDEALPSYSESSETEDTDEDMDGDHQSDMDAEHHDGEHHDGEQQDGEQQNDLDGELRNVASQALEKLPGEADPDVKAPGGPEIKEEKHKNLPEHIQSDMERNESVNGNSESEHNRMDVDPKVSDAAVSSLLALKSPNIPPSTISTAAPQNYTQSNSPTNGNLKSEPATSPTLHNFAISPYSSTLPAITSMPPPNSPPQPGSTAASHGERPNLPPLHSHLNQLAEAAEKESTQPFDVRTNGAGTGPRPPFPSVVVGAARSPPTAQAGLAGSGRPRVQYMTTREQHKYMQNQQQPNHYPSSGQYSQAQTSPVSVYSETSPQEAFPHGRELPSPPPGPGAPVSHPYWFSRRSSQTSVDGQPFAPAPQPESSYPPPPTTDSSTPASMGGTPRDHRMSIDETPHPTPTASLTPQQAGPPPVGGFRCDHVGCTATPFQTQYLLNSHANVHSTNRPHYCPVKGCSRGEGGMGFKRKNEMIRHGLVHDSPGYVCPFCPDREHKYPRPDNLQRHVRVHHVDKDKDDPSLREVLAQRPEGGNRGRRRRLGT
ncbi:hypothetical protein FGG08_003068 [Glutinoglossum americanum]|uniref:C2H2-type domain-containing protein n=1 Tax=Glutinoglossum americanum TaxID=1670608 RepID=A0A9P8IBU1_9PEZI|nr:hypothetical protein FGG08_003068 [Glutinoglossum americanum]